MELELYKGENKMEKYLLINIQYIKDGSQSQTIADYTDEDDARSAYHSTLASNYADKTNLQDLQ